MVNASLGAAARHLLGRLPWLSDVVILGAAVLGLLGVSLVKLL